jgi:hypothetical protein
LEFVHLLPPSYIDETSACHTERIKIKREVGEVAIVVVLAGRGIGNGGIHATGTTNLDIFVILVIWTLKYSEKSAFCAML